MLPTLRHSGALWNLSSCEELKDSLLQDVLEPLVQQTIAPKSKSKSETKLDGGVDVEVLYNATGCLRCGSRQDRRAGTLENCVCTLRNLSYQLSKEVPSRYASELAEPPPYPTRDMEQDEYMTPGCFSSKASKTNRPYNYDAFAPFSPAESDPNGMEWLWHPDMAKTYMDLLSKSSDNVVVEATAGALQNLTTGNSKVHSFLRVSYSVSLRCYKGAIVQSESVVELEPVCSQTFHNKCTNHLDKVIARWSLGHLCSDFFTSLSP
uniref:Uncharacterized protein n=1 Tax=Eptatretus burgeri TaxID=7764 RepID=A0A8C4R505_EPTBU